MTKLPTGELADELKADVLAALAQDEIFDKSLLKRDGKLAEVAERAASAAFSTEWHGCIELNTRDRIRHMVERHFAAPEPEPVDPVAESAQRGHAERDPWLRYERTHDPRYVQSIGGTGDLGIRDERGGRS